MLWSLTVMVEAQVNVISGTVAQLYFTKEDSTPKRVIRSSLRIIGAQQEGRSGITIVFYLATIVYPNNYSNHKKLGEGGFGCVFKDIHGNDVKLSEYSGKVLLIVNVASKW